MDVHKKNKVGIIIVLGTIICLSVFITCGVPIALVSLSAINTNNLTRSKILEIYGEPFVEMQMPNEELCNWIPRAKLYPETDVLMVYSIYGHTLLIASSSKETMAPGCYKIPSIITNGIPTFYFITGATGIIVGVILVVLTMNFQAIQWRCRSHLTI